MDTHSKTVKSVVENLEKARKGLVDACTGGDSDPRFIPPKTLGDSDKVVEEARGLIDGALGETDASLGDRTSALVTAGSAMALARDSAPTDRISKVAVLVTWLERGNDLDAVKAAFPGGFE